jgi:quercetin dioxygenase-like cupin family protein
MRFLVILLASLLFAGGASALAAGTAPTVVAPSQIHWTPGKGPLKGTQVANLFGDPAKPGAFVTRIRMPDGLKFGPHYHPVLENVTVLQGTLMIGVGDKMNVAKMISLPAGSFFSVPAGVHHYAMSKGDTIIQLNDVGPWTMNPV